jgi:hypothetical protein
LAKIPIAAITLAVLLTVPCHARADTDIGAMKSVHQTVYGTAPNLQTTAKHAGDSVVFREYIETWSNSSAVLRFIDGSHLTVGQKSKVLIDAFVFNPEKGTGNALIRISAGALRFVTGAMPKGQTVIKTPTATLTLRGTDLSVQVHPNGTTDVAVHEGIVGNHNDKTGTDTTMNAGDQQTADQNGNHDDLGDPVDSGAYTGDALGNDGTERRNDDNDMNSPGGASEHQSAPSSSGGSQTGND